MSETAIFTLREAVARGASFLKGKGIHTARLDAELLIGAAVKMDRLKLYLNMDRPLDTEERDAAREFLRRRATHEPVAYILGKKEFRSREFAVSPAVLIPRPETELLVEHAEVELRNAFGSEPVRVLELGIGSGVISVSLACEMPQVEITATEISPDAAAVAERNAASHGVADRIRLFVQRDFAGMGQTFHAIVSNPPYISEKETSSLEPDVINFEPRQALIAADDGLETIGFILRNADRLLVPAGFVMLEIGCTQAKEVAQMAATRGLTLSNVWKDYAGLDRIVHLTRK